MMHGDSRVMVVVCLETASLPAPCLSFPSQIPKNPGFMGVCNSSAGDVVPCCGTVTRAHSMCQPVWHGVSQPAARAVDMLAPGAGV